MSPVNKIEGIVTNLTDIKVLKSGTSQKGKDWTLYGLHLELDRKQEYGVTGFNKKAIEIKMGGVTVGDKVCFQAEEIKGFWNVAKDSNIEIVSSGNQLPAEESEPKVERSFIAGKDEPRSAGEYWTVKFNHDVANSKKIKRQACLRIAIEFFAMNKDVKEQVEISEQSVIGLAKKFEEFVDREED